MSISNQDVLTTVVMYTGAVPKLWNETIEAHRRAVRDAILETTWALVAEQGLRSVTMSQIAEATGIGRATLYKYFPDLPAVLHGWHERLVHRHLQQLAEARDAAGDPMERLRAVLEAYASIRRGEPTGDLSAALHRGPHVARAHQHLHDFLADLLRDAAAEGGVRTDVPPDELADFCLHALGAAAALHDPEGITRLVSVTMAGLRAATRRR